MENAVKSNSMDTRYFQEYKFVCPDKLYPKEACDVRCQYSSTVPFSSNEDCQLDGQPALNALYILAMDKISIRKGHRYLTVVLDYLSGRILFVGKDRKAKTLKRSFNNLRVGQRKVSKRKVVNGRDKLSQKWSFKSEPLSRMRKKVL